MEVILRLGSFLLVQNLTAFHTCQPETLSISHRKVASWNPLSDFFGCEDPKRLTEPLQFVGEWKYDQIYQKKC